MNLMDFCVFSFPKIYVLLPFTFQYRACWCRRRRTGNSFASVSLAVVLNKHCMLGEIPGVLRESAFDFSCDSAKIAPRPCWLSTFLVFFNPLSVSLSPRISPCRRQVVRARDQHPMFVIYRSEQVQARSICDN